MAAAHSKDQIGISQGNQVLEVDLEALYAELASKDGDGEGLHLQEICVILNTYEKKVQRFIREAMAAGYCTRSRKKKEFIDGRIVSQPSYIFHPKEGVDK